MRHCIVTPEIPPITENGGVATNARNLAEFLCMTAGHEVTVLSTRPTDGAAERARKLLKKSCGASYFALDEIEPKWDTKEASPLEHARSLEAYWWLREQDFDVIHFMQYECAGFASIRAKRLGKSFHNTKLVVIFNSPNRWLEEHGQRIHEGTARAYLIDYMERYCAQHADWALAPTAAMLEWLRRDHWTLTKNTLQIPTFNPPVEIANRKPQNRHHFIFFGRLETRKGIELFAQALRQLAEDEKSRETPLKITFLGKISLAGGKSSNTYLREQLANLPEAWSWEILSDYSRSKAMRYLEAHSGSIFLIPSLVDNSPNTLLECIGRGLYTLCADTPGVGELCADDYSRFLPTTEDFTARLKHVLENGLKSVRPAVTQNQAVAARLDFLSKLELELKAPQQPSNPISASGGKDFISVIVPHHNLGKYLPETIQALEGQSFTDYEIIVVDDGSSDQASLMLLTALERRPADPKLKILRTPNRGVCAARNAGAALAKGNLLAFVDADNVPLPDMLATLHRQLRHAGLDCLTCNLFCFEDGEEIPTAEGLRLYAAFAGGSLEACLYRNSLGDANLLVTRDAFDRVGGFRSTRNEASADRAFLVRVLRSGLKLDCTDDCVFAYRRRPQSMSRIEESYFRSRTVLEAYTENQDPWIARVLESSFPIYGSGNTSKYSGDSDAWQHDEVARLREELEQTKMRYRREREKRRERHHLADSRYQTLLNWRSNLLVRIARNLGLVKRDY